MPFRSAFYMTLIAAALFCAAPAAAEEATAPPQERPQISTDPGDLPFEFMDIKTLDEMEAFLKSKFPPGTDRSALRKTFVEEGKATLFAHPRYPGVEKYIYDVNLCYYYIFRWNISADYDKEQKLERIYLNGREIYGAQDPIIATALTDKVNTYVKQRILKVKRPRPEAYKGETSIAGLIYDRDGDLGTGDDQKAITVGPTRADPMDMGKMTAYTDVLPWRSILDQDNALVVGKTKNCLEADIKHLGIKTPAQNNAGGEGGQNPPAQK